MGGSYLLQGLSSGGAALGQGIEDYFKRRRDIENTTNTLGLLGTLGDTDPTTGKFKPWIDPQAMSRMQDYMSAHKTALNSEAFGTIKGLLLANAFKTPRDVAGQTVRLSDPEYARYLAQKEQTEAIGKRQTEYRAAGEELPSVKARTRLTTAQAESAEAKQAAAEKQPMVTVDINGVQADLPFGDVFKHPDWFKQNVADPVKLDKQTRALTGGLGVPDINEAYNRRIVNGQLEFEAPEVQTAVSKQGKVIPKIDPKTGEYVYKTEPDPSQPAVVSKRFWGMGPEVTTPATKLKMKKYTIPTYLTPDIVNALPSDTRNKIENVNTIKEQLSQPAQQRGAKIVGRGQGTTTKAAAPVQVKTLEEAKALAPGTVFIDPNGQVRTR